MCAVLLTARVAGALDVPARMQARLIAKVAEYDRNLVRREGIRVILLVRKVGDAESASVVDELAAEFGTVDRIAGGPHRHAIVEFVSAADLAEKVKTQNAALVYLSSGLQDQIGGVAKALEGISVLTVGAGPGDAERGMVLGFDMVSGRVQIVVNLARAKAQNAAFRPEFLRLARVIR